MQYILHKRKFVNSCLATDLAITSFNSATFTNRGRAGDGGPSLRCAESLAVPCLVVAGDHFT